METKEDPSENEKGVITNDGTTGVPWDCSRQIRAVATLSTKEKERLSSDVAPFSPRAREITGGQEGLDSRGSLAAAPSSLPPIPSNEKASFRGDDT